MTSFQGPFAVVSGLGGANTRATAARIGSDGSAQFAGDAIVSGRLRNGPVAGIYGQQSLVQAVTVDMQAATARTSIMNFPTGAAITRISFVRLEDVFATVGTDLTMKISTSAGGAVSAYYNTVTLGDALNSQAATSWTWPGTSNFGLMTAASTLVNLPSTDTKWFVETTAVSGAVTGKRGFLTVEYFRRN